MASLGKKVEREKMHQAAREMREQKCAFLKCTSPCLHHRFCLHLWLCVFHLLYPNFLLDHYFTLAMHLTIYFIFPLYCSKHVIPFAHWLWHLLWHLLSLLQLWLLMKFNSLPWFFFFHLYTYLWKIPCHLGFTFTLALPPRMGAFPPRFSPSVTLQYFLGSLCSHSSIID